MAPWRRGKVVIDNYKYKLIFFPRFYPRMEYHEIEGSSLEILVRDPGLGINTWILWDFVATFDILRRWYSEAMHWE